MVDNRRLNKYIADSGYCSRREADKLIEQGKVTINGRIAQIGERVAPNSKVVVNKQLISHDSDKVYIALNKPIGIVCTTDLREPNNIVSFVNYPARIYPVGRLDKDSEGLILLTSDGDIVNKILRAQGKHDKEYEVKVDKTITQDFLDKMASGVPILGQKTLPCKIYKTGNRSFRIILIQGLNRQIRRMCEYLGYNVVNLKRTRIMNINLGRMKVGQWRPLSDKEIRLLSN
ncbi:MAG: 23S rRNA pseudouridine(2604) synthase RluF, partial [Christensenellaceae bacterium]|nr:23S rRNA pseudouridine(2604) synthase RluF [Christensenellaceae bacterium]